MGRVRMAWQTRGWVGGAWESCARGGSLFGSGPLLIRMVHTRGCCPHTRPQLAGSGAPDPGWANQISSLGVWNWDSGWREEKKTVSVWSLGVCSSTYKARCCAENGAGPEREGDERRRGRGGHSGPDSSPPLGPQHLCMLGEVL